jgi:1,4-alpha-glucan branching enzyme
MVFVVRPGLDSGTRGSRSRVHLTLRTGFTYFAGMLLATACSPTTDAPVTPVQVGEPPSAVPGSTGDPARPGSVGADAGIDPIALPAGLPPSGRRMGATLDRVGAKLLGSVTFRVWAGAATAASVVIADVKLPMQAEGDGYFALTTPAAKVGDVYTYELTGPAGTVVRQDPYAREVQNGRGRVIDANAYAWKSPRFPRQARESLVIYEMHVGSFSPPPGSKLGTFASTRARLPYLNQLGVNALQYMPLHDFGGNPNGWGYNPLSYFAPKQSYGKSDELRALVDDAHELGLGSYLDVVYNHYDGWSRAPLRCFDGNCADGRAGIYFFPPGPWAATPWGPRPNYSEPRVLDYLLDSTDQWLSEFRGDGFRWDSVSNVRGDDGKGIAPMGKELISRANDWAHAKGALSIAEDLKGYATITQKTTDGGFGFDAQWDGFGYTMMDVLTPSDDNGRDMGRLQGALASSYNGDPFARLLWIENHDTVGNNGRRFHERCDGANPTGYGAQKRTLLAATLLMTVPGIPMLFQGQELLAQGTFTDPPTPTDWTLATSNAKTLAFYKDIIGLRRNLTGNTAALSAKELVVVHRNDDNKVLAFRRGDDPANDVVVVVNLRNRAYTNYDIGVRTGGGWQVRLDTDLQRYNDSFGQSQAAAPIAAIEKTKDGLPFTVPVRLGPWSAVVLSKR